MILFSSFIKKVYHSAARCGIQIFLYVSGVNSAAEAKQTAEHLQKGGAIEITHLPNLLHRDLSLEDAFSIADRWVEVKCNVWEYRQSPPAEPEDFDLGYFFPDLNTHFCWMRKLMKKRHTSTTNLMTVVSTDAPVAARRLSSATSPADRSICGTARQ